MERALPEANLRSKLAQRAQNLPRRGRLLEGGSPTNELVSGTGAFGVLPAFKNSWQKVWIGAKKRANPNLRFLQGALRRRKKRAGLS